MAFYAIITMGVYRFRLGNLVCVACRGRRLASLIIRQYYLNGEDNFDMELAA